MTPSDTLSVYREPDAHSLASFGQHLGLAIALLDQFRQVPARSAGATIAGLQELEHEAQTAWESLWDQLGQARDIVRSLGRDTSAYDAAREAAGDIWVDAAKIEVRSEYGRRRVVRWRCTPLEPAESAISALRGAVPEVVVSDAPPRSVELYAGRKRVAEYGPLAIIIAGVAWALWHFVV